MQRKLIVMTVLAAVVSACHWVPRHRDEVVGAAAGERVGPAYIESIPPHEALWTVPGPTDDLGRHIVGTVRVEESGGVAAIATDWLEMARPERVTSVRHCAEGWVFVTPSGASFSATFTGTLEPMGNRQLTECEVHDIQSDDWEGAAGAGPWTAIVEAHPTWLAADASDRFPEVLVVPHWRDGTWWVYRRRDAKRLHEVPMPPDSAPLTCFWKRFTPGDVLIAWCHEYGRPSRGFISSPVGRAPVTWRSVDDGTAFPDGLWLVDSSECAGRRGCVRDGRSRRPVDWLGKLEMVESYNPHWNFRRAESSTYQRWHLSVHVRRTRRSCARSKVGCWSKRGPLRLLITDVSTGKRRWIPVDGKQDLSKLGAVGPSLQPYWTFDGAIYATAIGEDSESRELDRLYIGRPDAGLTYKPLPSGLDAVRFVSERRGVAWGPRKVVWTTDGGSTWTAVDSLPRWYGDDAYPTSACDEGGCIIRGVWIGFAGAITPPPTTRSRAAGSPSVP